MLENEVKPIVKGIINNRIKYDFKRLDIKSIEDSDRSCMTSFAVICKDQQITTEIISDLMSHHVKNNSGLRFVSLVREIENLDWEVIVLEAEIKYL